MMRRDLKYSGIIIGTVDALRMKIVDALISPWVFVFVCFSKV